MEGYVIAVAVTIPVILFPTVFVWYLTFGGIYAAVRGARKAAGKKAKVVA